MAVAGRLPLSAAGLSRAVGPISLGAVQMRSCVFTREGVGDRLRL
jgi:hypothetical protein